MTSGTLWIVSTPIGNMEDITLRAIRILNQADLVAAEDTRYTARLLSYHNIKATLISCHEYNERERAAQLIEKMKSGMSVALVSDAGTPSVSDPGYFLVKEAIANDIQVVPIPGPSAAITALSVSGLPTDSFIFIGFLSKQKGKRLKQLELLAQEKRTLIFYESPHRIIALIVQISEIMGDRQAVFGREMTKTYEEFIRGSLSSILETLKERSSVKGECTLIVEGCEEKSAKCKSQNSESSDISPVVVEEIEKRLAQGESVSDISKDIARQCGIPRKKIYEKALNLIRHA